MSVALWEGEITRVPKHCLWMALRKRLTTNVRDIAVFLNTILQMGQSLVETAVETYVLLSLISHLNC